MAQQINDLILSKLSALGFVGSVDDMLNQWLVAETGQTGATSDLWYALFDQAGIDRQVNDALFQWLGLQGHTEPSLSNRWYSYWESL